MRQRGASLIEVLVAAAILTVLASVAVANLNGHIELTRLLGAGRVFKGEFRKARSIAVMRNVQTAMRFEEREDGVYYTLYADGNYNGVLSRDIARGVDHAIGGPYRLDANMVGVRVGIMPGIPAPPPDSGTLDPDDPVRFGRSNMLSFSPLGTATPGTFYVTNDKLQAAVRVTGTSGRVRLMLYQGERWSER
jgi:prepilin-type N-terminal cleavage/methylation domain-containing protein